MTEKSVAQAGFGHSLPACFPSQNRVSLSCTQFESSLAPVRMPGDSSFPSSLPSSLSSLPASLSGSLPFPASAAPMAHASVAAAMDAPLPWPSLPSYPAQSSTSPFPAADPCSQPSALPRASPAKRRGSSGFPSSRSSFSLDSESSGVHTPDLVLSGAEDELSSGHAPPSFFGERKAPSPLALGLPSKAAPVSTRKLYGVSITVRSKKRMRSDSTVLSTPRLLSVLSLRCRPSLSPVLFVILRPRGLRRLRTPPPQILCRPSRLSSRLSRAPSSESLTSPRRATLCMRILQLLSPSSSRMRL
ncbi:conserved hypothetical protein [Neospora caninum Liverpool]|uniref:Uncharacterized protein n=1 Tax=Neospora caninum (strain Liverpool) TaxID=572307 RepID=F0V903_NEOCL|nr:conserved hypothetical protein [Neospora caninum Liverpool]CBZ50194.1 conserved hypothetical protein [Neospora caninum Liverpool]|eukprot:XP_003880229.1 conserved hypothetical protein [Neospora caninum Liverpool]